MKESKIVSCESCDHLLSIVIDDNISIFECPICGTLNLTDSTKKFIGVISANSPETECDVDVAQDLPTVCLSNLNSDLNEALGTLLSYGWELKFSGKQKSDK